MKDFDCPTALLLDVVDEAVGPNRELRKLRGVEHHDLATAVGNHVSAKQCAGGCVVEPVADVAAELARIIRKAGDEGYTLLLTPRDLSADITSRTGQREDAFRASVDRDVHSLLGGRRIPLSVDRERLPADRLRRVLGLVEEILAYDKGHGARHYGNRHAFDWWRRGIGAGPGHTALLQGTARHLAQQSRLDDLLRIGDRIRRLVASRVWHQCERERTERPDRYQPTNTPSVTFHE